MLAIAATADKRAAIVKALAVGFAQEAARFLLLAHRVGFNYELLLHSW